ncbi:MAG: acetyl-CoA C-acetyltransferase [Nocardioides sp.]|nr:acetyl-CoA C-acetyltransferase [Nocardioides sp.]
MEAFIVDAVRSPVGRRNGGLSQAHPADLAAAVLSALVARTGVDPDVVDDVILGCVDQVGVQSLNIARTAWLSAGLPEGVPATTIDRQCGSSQQAVHFAAQGIQAGAYDLAVAGGVEVMSRVPLVAGADPGLGLGEPFTGEGWVKRYGTQEISQFRGAELIAEKWDISRDEMELLALESHRRALDAWEDGRFDPEVVSVYDVHRDEGMRADTSLERMSGLQPIREGGRHTAALASQISDGAAALLLASEAAVDRYGLVPRARIRSMSVVGSDPVLMLTGPIPATEKVLDRAGVALADVDLFEVNEAFASVVLAWQAELGVDPGRVNVNGGAIALGHPLGATGARLMKILLAELERRKARFGLQTMCEGAGMANATLIERL